MKQPKEFTGKDKSKFRSWWKSVLGYMEVQEVLMPTDKIKILWVGSLMTDYALNWFQNRQNWCEANKFQDQWNLFKEAIEEQFKDSAGLKKDTDKMNALKYKDDMDDYINQLEDLNTRVGATGALYRNMIIGNVPWAIIEKIQDKHGGIPDEDVTFMTALKIAGRNYEEGLRLKAVHHGSSKTEKGKQDAVPSGKGNQKDRKAERQGSKEPDKGSGDKEGKPEKPTRWAWGKALVGVPKEEITKHIEAKADCKRCGRNNHKSHQCFATKTVNGVELPKPPPIKQTTISALPSTKRKREEGENTESGEKTATRENTEDPEKKPRISAITDTDIPMWAVESPVSDF
jgi:hypothetical protein